MWDVSTPFGARVERRLAEEQVIWLVTAGKEGLPQPSPVWFLREGETLLIYSKPSAPKLRNIAREPHVALHFNTNPHGDDVVIFHGSAAAEPDAPPPNAHAAYLEKYRAGIANIGMTPERFAEEYSSAIRVRLEKLRGF